MRIEIWADVVCPWAYIGKRRLERALAQGGLDVEAVWRPYRIDPSAPARAVPLGEALADPAAGAALEACAPGLAPSDNRERVARIAEREGLGPRWGAAWRADSHDAHRLVAAAFEHGGARLQDAVVEGVLKAHFVDALDISAPDVLGDVALRAGFPDGPRLLAEGAADALVRELVLTGRAMGVRTSPTLVANGAALAGAQSPEAIAEFLRHAAGRRPSAAPEEVERLREVLDVDDLVQVTASQDVEEAKPEPELVEVALERAGVPADRAVFVGDSVWDVQAAVRAGVPCVAVLSGGTSAAELTEAGAVAVHDDVAVLLRDLEAGGDLKNIVLRCYRDMSRVLSEQRGIERELSMTPREFERQLQAAGLRDEHIQRLTRLFEQVRYGPQQADPQQEREAAACLQAIVRTYGAPAS